mgnify:CR=1 FL=1|jgi:hypothetical protein
MQKEQGNRTMGRDRRKEPKSRYLLSMYTMKENTGKEKNRTFAYSVSTVSGATASPDLSSAVKAIQ